MRTIRPTAFGPVPIICNALYQYSRSLTHTGTHRDEGMGEEERKEAGEGGGEAGELRFALGDRLSSIKVTSAPIRQEVVEFMR